MSEKSWHEKNRLADKIKHVESPEVFHATIGFDFVFARDKKGRKTCYCIELNGQESGTWGIADIEDGDHLRKVMTLSRNTFNPERQALRAAIERLQNRGDVPEEVKQRVIPALERRKKAMPLAAYALVNPPAIEEIAEDKGLQAEEVIVPEEYRLRTYVDGASPLSASGYWVIMPRTGRRGDNIRVVSDTEFGKILANEDPYTAKDDLLRFCVAQEYARAAGADNAPHGYEDNPASMRLLLDFRFLEDGTIHILHEDGYQRVGPHSYRQMRPEDTSMSVVNKARGAKAVDMSSDEFRAAHEAALAIIRNLATYYEKNRAPMI